MNKWFVFVCLIVGSCGQLLAQSPVQTVDSRAYQNLRFSHDSIGNYLYQYAKNNPFYLHASLPDHYSSIDLTSKFDKGKYIPIQGSTQTQEYQFNTEGKAQLGGIQLFGNFNYHKIFEDSTRWLHQTRNIANMPLSHGSIHNNHYERSVYNFKAMAEKALLKGNLPLSVYFDYRIGTHFSNNDPRGDIKDFNLNTVTTLAHQFNRLKVGVSYRYGYGREDLNIGYKNTNLRPFDQINWRMAGYGITEEYSLSSLLEHTILLKRTGLDANLAYTFNNKNELSLKVAYLENTDHYVRMAKGSSSTTATTALLDYDSQLISADLFWQHKAARQEYLFQLSYRMTEGKDLYYPNSAMTTNRPDEVIYKYNNYLFDQEQLAAKALVQHRISEKKSLQGGLEVNRFNQSKQDGSTGNHVGYERYTGQASLSYQQLLERERSWSVALNGTYSFHSQNTFVVPLINEKIFYKYVIYHDYLFNTSNYAGVGLNGSYSFPAYQVLQAQLKMGLQYLRRSGEFQPLQREILSQPGNDRVFANLSLNLYF